MLPLTALLRTADRQDGRSTTGLSPADPDPAVQARRDAEAVCARLTDEQRRRAAGASGWGTGDPSMFLIHLARAREGVLRGDVRVPAADREQAPTAAQLPRGAALSGLSRGAAWLALAAFGIMVAGSVMVDGRLGDESRSSALLGTGMSLVVLFLTISAVSGTRASRRRDELLLDWACGRPGQLARGIPAAPHITHRDRAATLCSGLLRGFALAYGILGTLAGAALLVLGPPASTRVPGEIVAAGFLVTGILVGVAAFVWNRRARQRLTADGHLRRALLWVETVEASELPAAGSTGTR